MDQFDYDDAKLQDILAHYQDALQEMPDFAGDLQTYSDPGTLNSWEEFSFVFPQCFYPTLRQGVFDIVGRMVGLSLVLRALCLLGLPPKLLHCASAILGTVLLWLFYDVTGTAVFWLFCGIGYVVLRVTPRKRGVSMAVYIMLFLITSELFFFDAVTWHKWRGSLLVLAMKMLSVGFDIDGQRLPQRLPAAEFSGFAIGVTSIMFGPFFTYQDYSALEKRHPVSWWWLLQLLTTTVIAIGCLIVSSCVAPLIFTEVANKWLLAYTSAMAFRFSHYFVCYTSEATTIASGLGAATTSDGSLQWSALPVGRLSKIELPRSLPEVVTYWNMAMHVFLKNYVFKPSRHLGHLAAILITYFASAMLHGLNFQLSAVLLSIGVYAYIENGLREKLSKRLSACIRSRACQKDCSHNHKGTRIWVRILNCLFGLLAMFHLTYLGLMFGDQDDGGKLAQEGFSMQYTLLRWQELHFSSHIVAAATYIISIPL